MKRILIICNYFAPENGIAAVRISKIAKYLRQAGYEVTVLTEKKNDVLEDEILKKDTAGIKVLHAENSRLFQSFYAQYEKFIYPHKDKRMNNLDNRKRVNPKTGKVEFYLFETAYPLIGSVEYLVGQLKQFDLYRSIKDILKNNAEYEYVFTSYGDSFSYFSGRYFHKKHMEIPWVFDIRDAIYRYKFTPDYVRWIAFMYERYIWKHANAIIGISKGICKRVPRQFRNKVHLVTNGYDLSDRDFLEISKKANTKLKFTYTGSMYGGLIDLTLFFKALHKLIINHDIDEQKIEIQFAGNEPAYQIFRNQAKESGLDRKCKYYGKLTRRDAMSLQANSDILLMASHDYKDNVGGVLTGKLMEYMMMKHPVIAIVNGDIENGEVYQTINQLNIGHVLELSNYSKGFKALQQYIKQQYTAFFEYGAVDYRPDVSGLDKYNYRNLIKKVLYVLKITEGGKRQ